MVSFVEQASAFSEASLTYNCRNLSEGFTAHDIGKFTRGKGSDPLHLLGMGLNRTGTSRPELWSFSYSVLAIYPAEVSLPSAVAPTAPV